MTTTTTAPNWRRCTRCSAFIRSVRALQGCLLWISADDDLICEGQVGGHLPGILIYDFPGQELGPIEHGPVDEDEEANHA